ncbi:Tuberous sclerosis 2-like protein, partial [Cryomyces antarcticus]
DGQDQFYKVQVLSKAGFPSISAAAEAKIISGRSLAAYVRLLALNASVFSLVWAARDSGEYISSWRARLREIKKLREKHAHADADATATAITQPMPAALDGLRGTISSPPGTRDSAALRRTSATALSSEGTNRSSVITTASETERTESSDSRD